MFASKRPALQSQKGNYFSLRACGSEGTGSPICYLNAEDRSITHLMSRLLGAAKPLY